MKQSESDKILGKVLRDISKKYGWNSGRGFVFKKDSLLFFSILINGQPKTKRLSWSLTYKYYEFDDLFWKIVKPEENLKQPLSFRACGIWVVPSVEIDGDYKILDKWGETQILEQVENIIQKIDTIASDISMSVKSPEDNLKLVEKLHKSFLERYPDAVRDIWMEKILTNLVLGNVELADEIARSRVKANDTVGFNCDGKSFYELVIRYLKGSGITIFQFKRRLQSFFKSVRENIKHLIER
jgi:transcriptional regulator